MNRPRLLNLKPFQQNFDAGYCGPACLKMILEYYGIEKSEDELAQLAGTTKTLGTDDKSLKRVLESFGLRVVVRNESTFDDIQTWLKRDVPVIVDWFTRGHSDYSDSDVPDGHYSVVVGLDEQYIYLQDPELGKLRQLARDDFLTVWFDFEGKYINANELIVRQLIAVSR